MKKVLKSFAALMLALVVAFTATGTTVEAASAKVTFKNSGKVSTVLYKGAKAKKAKFKLNSAQYVRTFPATNGNFYDEYDVNLQIERPSYSKGDVINIVTEAKKKGTGAYYDYVPVIIGADGNYRTDCGTTLSVDYSASSKSKTIYATSGYRRYWISGWRKKTVWSGKIQVPSGSTGVYVGFAGLRAGQITKKQIKNLNKANYYKAGFGNKKKGYVVAGQIV
ncbi:MAG: hypothetical protein E7302_15250 [Butyrivibrio sp.]|jgi:hypothetical protein|nr:hypothetical protein [Butyrivibrio sp.]